jgi:exodeoxyribonuclease V alpha subunit
LKTGESFDLVIRSEDGLYNRATGATPEFMVRLDGQENRSLALAAALLSHATGFGHICLDLKTARQPVSVAENGEPPVIVCPDLSHWVVRLKTSSVVGDPGDYCPLILDRSQRLYLHRYWNYEKDLISAIQLRIERQALESHHLNSADIADTFNCLFPDKSINRTIDWQKVAVLVALMKPFCVLTGGPGTGKTHTIAKILAMLIAQADVIDYRVALAAPTGKAAAKLSESLKAAVNSLACSQNIKDRIPVDAQTIHRLMVPMPSTPYFHYNKDNPLPVDAVVVDEASMVDMALLSKLATSLSQRARLILVGDNNQLASVEAGAVLGDICGYGKQIFFSPAFCDSTRNIIGSTFHACGTQTVSGIQDCIVNLVKNYRFDEKGGIGTLSRAVNSGDKEKTFDLLYNREMSSVKYQPVSSNRSLYQSLSKHILKGYRDYLSAKDPLSALKRFGQFRILCAVNKGPRGVYALNRLVENVLQSEDLINLNHNPYPAGWYIGRPILVTVNDYNLGIFNGEIGLAIPASNSENPHLAVHFTTVDGQSRQVPATRLSGIETAFAITIHKSQGSEFDQLHVILPEIDSAILTRELIYTAITRAKSHVTIWGSDSVLEKALSRRIERRSGLREALWGRVVD